MRSNMANNSTIVNRMIFLFLRTVLYKLISTRNNTPTNVFFHDSVLHTNRLSGTNPKNDQLFVYVTSDSVLQP